MDSNRDDERPELESPIVQGLGQAVPQIDQPAELRARVLNSIGADSRVQQDPAYLRSAGLPGPAERAGSSMWWLATAAALALAAGMTIYTVQLRGRIAVLEGELREARIQADASQRQVADIQRTAASAQSAVAVLSAPDVARVDLAGQPAAPQASGRAFWSRSRGVVFSASNLPQLPAGRTYQLWVVTATAPISAGLLKPDLQGGVSEIFATPANIPAPVAIAVTIEPEGGVPAPTGDKYLVGAL